jgi:hypothetical protein
MRYPENLPHYLPVSSRNRTFRTGPSTGTSGKFQLNVRMRILQGRTMITPVPEKPARGFQALKMSFGCERNARQQDRTQAIRLRW